MMTLIGDIATGLILLGAVMMFGYIGFEVGLSRGRAECRAAEPPPVLDKQCLALIGAVARRFIPPEGTIQWELRECDLRDAVAALDRTSGTDAGGEAKT